MKNITIAIIGIIFLTTLISAQPFDTEFSSDGLRVLAPENFPLKQNEGFNFTFHVVNTTSGEKIQPENVNCNFFLYDKNGSIMVNQKNISGAGSFFYTFVTADNFSDSTKHDFVASCSALGTDFGGSVRTSFKVTPTGQDFTTGEALGALGSLFTSLVLSFFFVFLGNKLSENENLLPIGLLFGGLSIILVIYSLFLGFTFSIDIANYTSLGSIQELIFISVLWIVVGISVITIALMMIAFIKQLVHVVEKRKFGDDWNPVTKSYDLT